jgi:hypothetical protein
VRSAKLGYLTAIRLVKWMFGKAEPRAEPTHEELNKDNSAIEDFKEFFKQCLRPFQHSWKSTCRAGRRIVLEWRDFRAWHKDPIYSSQQPPTYWSEVEPLSMVLPQSGTPPQSTDVVETKSGPMAPRTRSLSSFELSPVPPRSSTMPIMSPGLQSPMQPERSAYRSSRMPSTRSTYEQISTDPSEPQPIGVHTPTAQESTDPSEPQLIDMHTPTAQASTDSTNRPLTPPSQSSHGLQHSPTAPLLSEGPSMRTTFKRANTDH